MKDRKTSLPLVLTSLGLVYGAIGTSPLYAIRVTLAGLKVSPLEILGVLSLIIWSLFIIISLKYLLIFFRADNEGEGGILALFALIKQKQTTHPAFFFLLAIFGVGLLFGDGVLMPATSVMSAIEGLHILSPVFSDLAPLLSAILLILLFSQQSKGTEKIGFALGPIMFVWFIVLAILGLASLWQLPSVLKAFNPYYAYLFLHSNGIRGFFLLGGIFLVVTGGEAVYANIGMFGKNSIRWSWFAIVLPSLLLNYLGQGANLILHPAALQDPFYTLSPNWFFIPLLLFSTLASVIASQAIILAMFSVTKQAILLGLCPKISIIQTSQKYASHIYIPQMNYALLLGTLVFIYAFGSSSNVAHAYGIAVNVYMLLVTIMVTAAARKVWHWSYAHIALVFPIFMAIDLAFLAANAHKIASGGWAPLVLALIIAIIMLTWREGLLHLQKNFYMQKTDLNSIISELQYDELNQLPGLTAIFITDIYDRSGGSFLHFLKLNLAIPENILIVNYQVENRPYVSVKHRFQLQHLDNKISQLTLHYGFKETVSIPEALHLLNESKLLSYELPVDKSTYFVEIPNVVASKKQKTLYFYWQERLFAFLMRNYSANLDIGFYDIPYHRTVAIGTYCII